MVIKLPNKSRSTCHFLGVWGESQKFALDHGGTRWQGKSLVIKSNIPKAQMMAKSSLKVLSRPEPKGLKPSRTLGKAGASLWASIIAEYDVSDSGGRELLLLACQALDRAESLREQIDDEGDIVSDAKGNRRDHPGLKHELQNRSFVAKALARLGLNLETPVRGVGRPVQGGLGVDRPVATMRLNGEDG
jgi:hypothetical protein